MGTMRIGGTTLTFQGYVIMWRHRSRDYLIPHGPFAIGAPLKPSLTVSETFSGERDAMVDMTW